MADGEDTWQASEARANFSLVVDRAAAGVPQVIRHRSGAEVVMVSRAAYESARPSLKEFLLRGGAGEDGEALPDLLDRDR